MKGGSVKGDASASREIRDDFVRAFIGMYAERGMAGMSVSSLCDKAGYSRSTFYRHFYSLESVLDEFENRVLPHREMRHLLDNAYAVGMRELTDCFLDCLYQRREYLRVLFLHDNGRFFDKMREIMRPVFRSQAERVYEMTQFEYDVFAEYLTTAKVTLLRMWSVSDSEASLGHMTQVTDATLEGGFWDLVEEAHRCEQEGVAFERVGIEELASMRPWIAYRCGIGE